MDKARIQPRDSAVERPHACYDGWVFVGVETEEGEVEQVAYLCKRCAAEQQARHEAAGHARPRA